MSLFNIRAKVKPVMNIPITTTEIGSAHVDRLETGWAMRVGTTTETRTYHDAQITDYQMPDRSFLWYTTPHKSIRLRIYAYFNTKHVNGTAGFGFWNHPFSPEMRGLPRLPRAAWFFYSSPPNNMPLAHGVSGWGWKCATINANRWQFLALAPFALPGFLAMRVPVLYDHLWHVGQAALAVCEHPIDLDRMLSPHLYEIHWEWNQIRFYVDEQLLMVSPYAIRGKMGFIAWIDNQYAIVTPQGQFGWGLVDVPQSQMLIVDRVEITTDDRSQTKTSFTGDPR